MKQLLVFLTFIFIGCNDSDNYNKMIHLDSVQDRKSLDAALDVALETINTAYDGMRSWNYIDTKDKMTGDSIHGASIFSNNLFHLKPPDKDSSFCGLVIKRVNGEDAVDLFVTDGKFKTINGKEIIKVKFDKGLVENFEFDEITNYGPTHLWIKDALPFINKLKMAKMLTIDVEVSNNGIQNQIFNVKGLVWN